MSTATRYNGRSSGGSGAVASVNGRTGSVTGLTESTDLRLTGTALKNTGTIAGTTDLTVTQNKEATFHAYGYGVVADGKQVILCTFADAHTLVAPNTGTFVAGDVGKTIVINSGSDNTTVGHTLVTTITSVTGSGQNAVFSASWSHSDTGTAMACWGTDDTTAWRACVQAACDYVADISGQQNQSATIICPSGLSVIIGARTDTSNSNCVLRLYKDLEQVAPYPDLKSIEIRGANNTSSGSFGQHPHMTGTILFFTTTGGGTDPSCIGSNPRTQTQAGSLALKITNVTIRQLDPCTMNGLNWFKGGDFSWDHLFCDTFAQIQTPVQPTFGTGVVLPGPNSDNANVGGYIAVYRYFTGVELSNQNQANRIYVETCCQALKINGSGAYHGCTVDFLLVQNTPKVLVSDGNAAAVYFPWIQVERSTAGDWRQQSGSEIDDAGNKLNGELRIVEVAANAALTTNGGQNIIQKLPFTPEVFLYYGARIRTNNATNPNLIKPLFDSAGLHPTNADAVAFYTSGTDGGNANVKFKLVNGQAEVMQVWGAIGVNPFGDVSAGYFGTWGSAHNKMMEPTFTSQFVTNFYVAGDNTVGGAVKLAMGEDNSFGFIDGATFVFGTSTGTKIGTATGQKIGFWGHTPVVQPVLATGAAKLVDDVITMLQSMGICKQS